MAGYAVGGPAPFGKGPSCTAASCLTPSLIFERAPRWIPTTSAFFLNWHLPGFVVPRRAEFPVCSSAGVSFFYPPDDGEAGSRPCSARRSAPSVYHRSAASSLRRLLGSNCQCRSPGAVYPFQIRGSSVKYGSADLTRQGRRFKTLTRLLSAAVR